jgi:hypothetical protein
MATTYLRVPVGTTAAIPINPLTCIVAGPSVLGGTVLVEFSDDGRGDWQPWQYGTIGQGGCFRPSINGYVRVTAATQPANAFLVDMSGSNTPNVTQLVSINNTMATASSTAEQVLACFRLPPNYLPANFNLAFMMGVSLSNNANVKTLRIRWGGVAGTALFTSPSLASALNYNTKAIIAGRGDGSSLIGLGPGASGGIGVSTSAYPTATVDYLNQESEVVITMTKATAGDTAQLESLMVALY